MTCSASVVLPELSGPYISMTRPLGRPPMPSAMSSPREPVEITSMSDAASREPSFMIEPLPKARSIWPSAASKARCLSIMSLSKRRNAVCMASHPILFHTGHTRATRGGQDDVPDLFTRQAPDAEQAPAGMHNPRLSRSGGVRCFNRRSAAEYLYRLYFELRISAFRQPDRLSQTKTLADESGG